MRITIVLFLLVTPVAASDLDLIAEQVMLIESGKPATVDVAYCEGRLYSVRGADMTAYNTWRLFLQCYGLNLENTDVPIHPQLREIATIYKDAADQHILTLWLFQVNRMLSRRTLTMTLQDMYGLPEPQLWSNLMTGRIASMKPITTIKMEGYDPRIGRVETHALRSLIVAIEAHNATKPVNMKIPVKPPDREYIPEAEIPDIGWVRFKAWLLILPVTIFAAFMLACLFRRPILFAAGVVTLLTVLIVGALIYVGPVIAVFLVAFALFLKSVGSKGLTIQEWIVGLW